MTDDATTAVDRLLRRRPDVTLDELEPGRPALVMRDQILVAARDAADVEGLARRWIDRVETDDDALLARVRLRPGRGTHPAVLAAELARPNGHRQRAVTANHVLRAAPDWSGGPADRPRKPHLVPTAPRAGRATDPVLTVAVLDTGISRHPWFEDEDWFGGVREQDVEGLDELGGDDRLDTQAGHGTFVVGVVRQAAPDAYIVAPKVLASDGVTSDFDLVRKLRRLRRWSRRTERHLDLVNLSFGGFTVDDLPSPHVADAVAALGRDTVVVACAGNDGSDRPFWPAALKSVIAVGALDANGDDRAPFSNYGWWVDACSIGERVASCFVTFDGPDPSTGVYDDDNFTGYAEWSGTSFAAPRVLGAIAAAALEHGISTGAAADRVLDPDATRAMPDLGVVVPGP